MRDSEGRAVQNVEKKVYLTQESTHLAKFKVCVCGGGVDFNQILFSAQKNRNRYTASTRANNDLKNAVLHK